MSKKNTKNTKIDALLDSDDSDDEPVVTKKKNVTKSKSPVKSKRKASATSEDSNSVSLLKSKRKQSKDSNKKSKKKVDSDSSDDEPVVKSKKDKKAKASKKKVDSSDDEEEVKKPVKKSAPKKKSKVDSDSDDEDEVKKPVKKAVDSDSDNEDLPLKNLNKNQNAQNDDDGETHTELFVRNLSYQSTEDSLWAYFEQFGELKNVKLLYDKSTGRAKGIGFVDFANRADAKNAMENLGEVDGRTPSANWSNDKSKSDNRPQRQNQGFGQGGQNQGYGQGGHNQGRASFPAFSGQAHTIFVGNLGFRTTEDKIKNFFTRAGNVVGIRVAKHEDGRAKGFCHVDFDSQEGAQSAIGYAGQKLDGREVRVDMSEPRKGGGGQGGFKGGRPPRSNIPKQDAGIGQALGKKVTFSDSDSD